MRTSALVYDTEAARAADLARRLGAAGVEAMVAPDLETAFALLRDGQYDLIVASGARSAAEDAARLVLAVRRDGTRSPAIILTLPRPGAAEAARSVENGTAINVNGLARAASSFAHLSRGGIEMDRLTREVRYRGTLVSLTPHEYRILECLLLRDGVVSREQLAAAAWGVAGRTSNALDVHLANLRRKLRAVAGRPLLRTSRGRGYTLEDQCTRGSALLVRQRE